MKARSVVTKTPMRITLGGGGTDIYWYSKLKGGAWIAAAIDKYVYVTVANSQQMHSLNIDNPIIRECLKMTQIDKGLEISTKSDVPAKSGLGGSGAFEVGLLNALYNFKGKKVSKLKLANEATIIEVEKLKMPAGPQDQYIAAIGGINYFEIDTNGKITVEPLNLSHIAINKLQENLLFFQTGIYHDTAEILDEQKLKAKVDNDQIIKSLDQIKELGQLIKNYLLTDKIDDFGKSLHSHWLIKKSLSSKVSNSQIDNWYKSGIKNGALGGKIMGAGGGGWFVFYVNKNHDKFKVKMQKLGLIFQNVNFDWQGTRVVLN